MKSFILSKYTILITALLSSNVIIAQLNLVQPTSISGTATPFTGSSTPSDLFGDPAISPTSDPTSTTVGSYSSGSNFDEVYIWNGIANTITMNFTCAVSITDVAIWNAFASGAYLNPGFLEPDHSVATATFEFFSGGTSLGSENINVLFPDDAFGELYPLTGTYNAVTQVVMTVLTNHGGNETAMQEIAFNTDNSAPGNITAVVSNSTICLGESVTITGTSSNGGVITWNNGVSNGVPFTPSTSGNHTYIATSSNVADCPLSVNIMVTTAGSTANANVDQTICAGGTISLSGNLSSGGAAVWSAPSGTFSNPNSLTSNYTPSLSSGTVTLTLTPSGGGSCAGTADQMIVTINPGSTVNANIDQTICEGSTVNLSGSFSGIATSATWSAPSGSFSNSANINSTYTPTITSGSVTLTLTTNAIGACPSITDNMIVNVSPVSTANANIDQTVCAGGTINLSGSVSGGANAGSWSAPSGSFLNNSNLNTSYTPTLSSGIVTLTLTSNSTSPCPVVTDQLIVTVDPVPTVNAGIDQIVCEGGVINLSGAIAGSASSSTWSAPSGTFSDANSLSSTYTPFISSNTISLTLTTNAPGACAAISDVMVVTVNPLPIVNAGIDQSVCTGESVSLAGSGASTYSWDNSIQNAVTFVPTASGIYTTTGTDINGCVSTDEVNVTVNPLPTISFGADNQTGCIPLTVNFTNTSTNTSSCLWEFGDGSTSDLCAGVSHVFTEPGCFTVTLTGTSINGCVGTTSTVDFICTEAYPVASFSTNAISILETEATFENTTTGASSYLWDFGDNTTSTNTNPIHTYENPDAVEIIVILIAENSFGCADTATLIMPLEDLLIYYIPNTFTPDNNGFNQEFKPVFTSGFSPNSFEMIIFNRWGEQVFQSQDASIGWPGTYGLGGGLNLCQNGVYTYKISFKSSTSDKRTAITGHVNLLR